VWLAGLGSPASKTTDDDDDDDDDEMTDLDPARFRICSLLFIAH